MSGAARPGMAGAAPAALPATFSAAPPAYLALVRGKDASIASTRWVLDESELIACEQAAQLLGQLQQLHAHTQATLDAERAQAREQGFGEGRAQALAQIAAQWHQSWEQAVQQARLGDEQLREAVVSLALQVVRRIAQREGAEATVAALARRALADMAPEGPAVLYVHPELREAIGAAPGLAGLEVRADETLALTGCVFQTPAGELIASLDTQLARAEAGLRQVGRVSAAGRVDLGANPGVNPGTDSGGGP